MPTPPNRDVSILAARSRQGTQRGVNQVGSLRADQAGNRVRRYHEGGTQCLWSLETRSEDLEVAWLLILGPPLLPVHWLQHHLAQILVATCIQRYTPAQAMACLHQSGQFHALFRSFPHLTDSSTVSSSTLADLRTFDYEYSKPSSSIRQQVVLVVRQS
jgi:hypothetical protein